MTQLSDTDIETASASSASDKPRVKVCVCTSYPAHCEPRGPRHARAFADFLDADVTFIDAAPQGQARTAVQALQGLDHFQWKTHNFPVRDTQKLRWLSSKIRYFVSRRMFSVLGRLNNDALNANLTGFAKLLSTGAPDVVMAHNIDTLLPAYMACQQFDAKLIFDSMEFHSDVGDSQDSCQSSMIRQIETICLPQCTLITTSSERVAEALRETYDLSNTMALYNTPKTVDRLPTRKVDGFGLYWRNATIGLGQRGLADAMRALRELPGDVTLNVQGRTASDGGKAVEDLADQLGIADRLVVHPPYRAESAVIEASKFHVGLCMERTGVRNHELTVSNKMFDYHMAGLAVVTSDLPSLRGIAEKSAGGLWYEPGNHIDLAAKVRQLYDDRQLYKQLSMNAREFAMAEGNLEYEMRRFGAKLRELFPVS